MTDQFGKQLDDNGDTKRVGPVSRQLKPSVRLTFALVGCNSRGYAATCADCAAYTDDNTDTKHTRGEAMDESSLAQESRSVS